MNTLWYLFLAHFRCHNCFLIFMCTHVGFVVVDWQVWHYGDWFDFLDYLSSELLNIEKFFNLKSWFFPPKFKFCKLTRISSPRKSNKLCDWLTHCCESSNDIKITIQISFSFQFNDKLPQPDCLTTLNTHNAVEIFMSYFIYLNLLWYMHFNDVFTTNFLWIVNKIISNLISIPHKIFYI